MSASELMLSLRCAMLAVLPACDQQSREDTEPAPMPGPYHSTSTDELIRMLMREAPPVGVLDELFTRRNEIIDPLVEALARSTPSTPAVLRLGPLFCAIGAPSVPPLAELLNSGDATARLNAMMTLGLMGPDARGALPTIVEALSDPSHEVRAEAARALRRLGPHDARVTILLASALDNDLDFSVRMNAALALSGSADATAERSLVLALTRDSEALVREAAASALASLPTLSSTSLAALRQYRLRKERQASTNR